VTPSERETQRQPQKAKANHRERREKPKDTETPGSEREDLSKEVCEERVAVAEWD
jgi:hypothetical protein